MDLIELNFNRNQMLNVMTHKCRFRVTHGHMFIVSDDCPCHHHFNFLRWKLEWKWNRFFCDYIFLFIRELIIAVCTFYFPFVFCLMVSRSANAKLWLAIYFYEIIYDRNSIYSFHFISVFFSSISCHFLPGWRPIHSFDRLEMSTNKFWNEQYDTTATRKRRTCFVWRQSALENRTIAFMSQSIEMKIF